MVKRSVQVSILMLGILLAFEAQAATYYVDWVSGVDTNSGTARTAPWKHAPGMLGCSNNCLTRQTAGLQPGDRVILKGGVTWPNAALGWLWTWNGSATASSPGCSGSGCIYLGVDQTWYAGGAWTRPKLDAGGSVVATRDGVANVLLRVYANYLVIDSIEFSGLYWTGAPAYGSNTNLALPGGTPGRGTNITMKNLYIHGWSHDTSANGTTEHPCAVLGDTSIPNNNVNSILQESVIDGSDTALNSCTAVFGAPPYIEKNFIKNVTSGIIANGTVSVDGNTITNILRSFDPGAHTNGIEINASRDIVISNNMVAHLGSGTLALWCAPNAGYTCTVFNNVIYDTDVNNVLDVAAPVVNGGCASNGTYCISGGTTNFYNNTVECGQDANPNAVCAAGINQAAAAVTIVNNHFITNATTPNGGVWSLASGGSTPVSVRNNLVQTKSVANGQGYAATQELPFSPINAESDSVGAGLSLTDSLCPSFPGLCTSAGVGVIHDPATHTVSYPNSRTISRDPWDVGAYQFSGSALAPPRNVTVSPEGN